MRTFRNYIYEGVKDLQKKWVDGGQVGQEFFDVMKSEDPSPTKKYLDWMLKCAVREHLRAGPVFMAVREFDKLVR